MDFSSFLQNKRKEESEKQGLTDKKVDFSKGVDEKELDPVPKPLKRPASSRLNDMLYSAPSQKVLASLPEEEKDAFDDAENKDDTFDDAEAPATPTKLDKAKEWLLNFFNKIKKNLKNKQLSTQKKAGGVIGVNLVKDEVIEFFDWQKNILILFVAIFFSFFAVAVAYWGISYWGIKSQAGEDQPLSQDYYRISKEIRDLEPQIQEMNTFQGELDKINFLLNKHIYWTSFFDFLERNTLADVYFFNFSGGTSGSYVLSGRAKYFEALDAQKKKFLEDEFVTSAKIKSGSLVDATEGDDGNAGIAFEINLTVNPDIFYK